MIKYYTVGGCVRDQILGLKPKDIDYSVEADSFADMEADIIRRGGTIFLSKPEYFTIRANIDRNTYDFVLCRKDGDYSDRRRPDSVSVGSIYDDLARRDFTVNAIALSDDGDYVDPYGGMDDIRNKIIRCVGSNGRLLEDPLRILRALRFSITKEFTLHKSVQDFLHNEDCFELLKSISIERIYEELCKMFSHDTFVSIVTLQTYKLDRIFSDTKIKLQPRIVNENAKVLPKV